MANWFDAVNCSHCRKSIPRITVLADPNGLSFFWLGREVYRLTPKADDFSPEMVQQQFGRLGRSQLEVLASEVASGRDEEMRRLAAAGASSSNYSQALDTILQGFAALLR